jgi:hypothetical protein
MTYRIRGLDPADFAPMFRLDDAALAAHRATRVTADAPRGYPCRISLEDAEVGDSLILLNHVSHSVDTPYRTTHAIYVREAARQPAEYVDRLPPAFAGRVLSLRGFDADAMMVDARLAEPGEADAGIRALFADPRIAYIHAHNALPGCFSAQIDRYEEPEA